MLSFRLETPRGTQRHALPEPESWRELPGRLGGAQRREDVGELPGYLSGCGLSEAPSAELSEAARKSVAGGAAEAQSLVATSPPPDSFQRHHGLFSGAPILLGRSGRTRATQGFE